MIHLLDKNLYFERQIYSMRNLVYLFLLSSGLSFSQSISNQPINVILMIADGAGLSQISAAYYYGKEEPNYSRFQHIGLVKTSASSHKITDSAAGATAYSTGKKTYNGAIGVDKDSVPVQTIVEDLSAIGYNTGLVVTSSVTHATPASFYAHVESRNLQEEIAAALVESDIDFFAGGGQKFFFNRLDGKNLWEDLKVNGFEIDTLNTTNSILDTSKKHGFLLAYDGLTPKHKGRGNFLPEMTENALDFLTKKGEPYFLLVEGSQVDWGGHANIGEYVIEELIDFDKTIGVVLDYIKDHPNTLVVVTADHETGGFTLASDQKELPYKKVLSDYNTIKPTFSTGGHSAAMVPCFASGPGSDQFLGVYENTKIHAIISQLTGLK